MNYAEMNKWRKENVMTCFVSLRRDKDADVIGEMLKRKEKYGTSQAFSLRRWVRMGFEQDKEF